MTPFVFDDITRAIELQHRGCTRKRTYRTKTIAKAYVKDVERRYGVLVKPYACRYCHEWHLTSRSK